MTDISKEELATAIKAQRDHNKAGADAMRMLESIGGGVDEDELEIPTVDFAELARRLDEDVIALDEMLKKHSPGA